LQLFSALMQPPFDGGNRQTGKSGNLIQAHFIQPAQAHNQAQVGGKMFDFVKEARCQGLPAAVDLSDLFQMNIDGFIEQDTGDSAFLPDYSQGAVSRDGGKPDGKTLRVVEIGDGPESQQERILHDIFSCVRAGHRGGNTQGCTAIAERQFTEGVYVAQPGRDSEGGIRRLIVHTN
jgi:hypothetical protein